MLALTVLLCHARRQSKQQPHEQTARSNQDAPIDVFAGLSTNKIRAGADASAGSRDWPVGPAASTWLCKKKQPLGERLVAHPERLLSSLADGTEQTIASLRQQHQELQAHAEEGASGNTALAQDMVILHRIARGLKQTGTTGGVVSLETGFANGGSAVAILSALDRGATHISIDPYQNSPPPYFVYRAAGLRGVQRHMTTREVGPTFVHINETASLALATLLSHQLCVDLFFMDDGHRFDDNLLELYHAHVMLKQGGERRDVYRRCVETHWHAQHSLPGLYQVTCYYGST